MILCLDGPYGVGKTSVALKLEEKFSSRTNIEILDADYYFRIELPKKHPEMFLCGGGTLPQNNKRFISAFHDVIVEKNSNDKIVIVVMALSTEESKNGILCKLREEGYIVIHIILSASKDTLTERIANDEKREDTSVKHWLDEQIHFFNYEMSNEKQIDTENRSVDSITDEIISMMKEVS